MRVKDVFKLIDRWAPFNTAAQWDKVGLQLGEEEAKVTKILVTLDFTPEALEMAVQSSAELVITHHPFFFNPLTSLTSRDRVGGLALDAARHEINLIAAHTNLDMAKGGVNDLLAERLGLTEHKVLVETNGEKLYKLAVYVPNDYLEQVRDALGEAGAGFIGNYSHCTFSSAGTGTFKPQAGSKPFIGEMGRLEKVSEIKVETIVPQPRISTVLNKLLEAHPYEEVAYDLFPLVNKGERIGFGRIGKLADPVRTEEFLVRVKKALDCGFLRVAGYFPDKVQKIAVLGGSGAEFIAQAAKAGADLFITADIKYHQAQEAEDLGILLVDPGHDVTEYPIVGEIARYLQGQERISQDGIEVMTMPLTKPLFTVF